MFLSCIGIHIAHMIGSNFDTISEKNDIMARVQVIFAVSHCAMALRNQKYAETGRQSVIGPAHWKGQFEEPITLRNDRGQWRIGTVNNGFKRFWYHSEWVWNNILDVDGLILWQEHSRGQIRCSSDT